MHFYRKIRIQWGCREIIKQVKTYHSLKLVADIYKVHMQKLILKEKSAYIVFVISHYYLQRLKRKWGERRTVESRVRLTLRNVFTSIANCTYDQVVIDNKSILTQYLVQWQWKDQARSLISNMLNQIKFVLRNAHENHQMNQKRRQIFSKDIWDEEWARMLRILDGSGSDAKQKKLWGMITKTSHDKKGILVDTYCFRQSIENKIEFMTWFIEDQDTRLTFDEDHPDTLSEANCKRSSYQSLIAGYRTLLEHFDRFLDKGVDKHNFKDRKPKSRKSNKSPQKKQQPPKTKSIELEQSNDKRKNGSNKKKAAAK